MNGTESDAASLSRRDLMRILAGVGGANALGALGWGGLEALLALDVPIDTWHRSVCRFCGNGCALELGFREGRLIDVRPNPNAHNRGVMCIKGTMLRVLNRLPGRLTTPRIRRDGALVDASWDEAMTLVARRFSEVIAEHGPDAVAFYGSGQLVTEESYTANKLFKAGIRTNNVDSNARLCMASAASGYTIVYGKDEPPGCYDDFHHATCFFLMGANPAECHPPIFEHIRRRRRTHRDTSLIVVDPRRTRTAQEADLHLAPVPGTDLLLLLSMAQVICSQGLVDRPFVERHVRFLDGEEEIDLDRFAALLDEYAPERVVGTLDVPAATIRAVAHRFATSTATTSMWTMGVNQRTTGTALNVMLNTLHLLTGQFGRPGATPFSLTGQMNACGGVRDTGALAHLLPNGRKVANEFDRAEMEALWQVPPGTLSPTPGLAAVDLFEAMRRDRVKACFIACTNPAQSMPNASAVREGLERAFVVVTDAFEDSETAKHADVVLPASLWIEKTGVAGQGERRYQLTEKLLDPPGEARSDLDILVDLADRLGHGALIRARTPEAVWDEWRALSGHSKYDFRGISYARLREVPGLQWPCPSDSHPGTPRRYVEGSDPFVSPGKGIEFYGHADHKAHVPVQRWTPSPETASTEYPLLLTTGRVLEQWHTGTMTGRTLELSRASGPALVHVHPSDARAAGVGDGDAVLVESRQGKVQGNARLTDTVRPGVLFVPFYDAALLVNEVTADHVDPISRQPELKVTAVRIARSA